VGIQHKIKQRERGRARSEHRVSMIYNHIDIDSPSSLRHRYIVDGMERRGALDLNYSHCGRTGSTPTVNTECMHTPADSIYITHQLSMREMSALLRLLLI